MSEKKRSMWDLTYPTVLKDEHQKSADIEIRKAAMDAAVQVRYLDDTMKDVSTDVCLALSAIRMAKYFERYIKTGEVPE